MSKTWYKPWTWNEESSSDEGGGYDVGTGDLVGGITGSVIGKNDSGESSSEADSSFEVTNQWSEDRRDDGRGASNDFIGGANVTAGMADFRKQEDQTGMGEEQSGFFGDSAGNMMEKNYLFATEGLGHSEEEAKQMLVQKKFGSLFSQVADSLGGRIEVGSGEGEVRFEAPSSTNSAEEWVKSLTTEELEENNLLLQEKISRGDYSDQDIYQSGLIAKRQLQEDQERREQSAEKQQMLNEQTAQVEGFKKEERELRLYEELSTMPLLDLYAEKSRLIQEGNDSSSFDTDRADRLRMVGRVLSEKDPNQIETRKEYVAKREAIKTQNGEVLEKMPEEYVKAFRARGVDGEAMFESQKKREADFALVSGSFKRVEFSYMTDRMGNCYISTSGDLGNVSVSDILKALPIMSFNGSIQYGYINDPAVRHWEEEDFRKYFKGAAGYTSGSAFFLTSTVSNPAAEPGKADSTSYGIRLNPIPSISTGVSRTDYLPESNFRLHVPTGKIGMTRKELDRMLESASWSATQKAWSLEKKPKSWLDLK